MEKEQGAKELEQKIKELEGVIQAQNQKEIELLDEIRKLNQSCKHYDTIMQYTDDFILICDCDGNALAYNNSYRDVMELYLKQDIKPGMQPYKAGPPELVKRWEMLREKVLKGEKLKAESSAVTDTGDSFFETIFCPVENGEVVTGFIEITRNITGYKKSETALRESNEFNISLLDNSPNAILVLNPDTSIRYVNRFFEEMTGYKSSEVIGYKIPYPWWVDDPEYGTLEEKKKQFPLGVKPTERRFRKKSGEYAWSEISITPIYKDGAMSYSLETMVDITDRKNAEEEKHKLEEKLHRSQKMESLGLLAGGVAHDLNNVLSGIVSYPELLLLDLPQESNLRKPIITIMESGKRAVAIVQDLLTIARSVATPKKTINLNSLINEYFKSPEFRQIEAHNPAITFKYELDNSLLNINGSYIHLKKIVMNLVSNASDAIEETGCVSISTSNRYLDRPLKGYDDVKTGEYALLTVSDNGTGISQADLNRIFEPFYSKKVMGRSGTGLGLAVVWNVMREHEGYINVTSDGNGTSFDLYFPITRGVISDSDVEIPMDSLLGKGERILVVDDIESQREISCSMLEKLGYRAHSAASGEEAVEYLKENSVDLIILDMIMDPGLNGRETYERIKKINPLQKAVIVSGFAETEDVKQTMRLGAGQFVKKPFMLQAIGMAIKEELKKS
ncbi:MAG: PAS domain S-box protein [Desulfatiglans sp.]|jgi:PAS domain S-box-containing protein|nr:PAS domain S-box protein [Desulfatiglans sp.]